MPSIIEGYNYDIFISYRQKDNKYDGWVTEFVDNLKRELESMFKDDVTVYFDINPSDYLLETYDVSDSLKEKLRCLVFIPVISRTYCDPKSFAWEYELKAFIKQASEDQFGLKIRLPNGNVANRVLPVKIHDLDNADIRLFESLFGGVMRCVDFVYKETGVNRQLRAKDDDITRSRGQVLYRDQINKVALATREIIDSLKSAASADSAGSEAIEVREEQEMKETFQEQLTSDSIVSEKQTSEVLNPGSGRDSKGRFLKSKILFPGVLAFIAILITAFYLLNQQRKVKWAKTEALPEIERLYNELNVPAAFDLLQKAEKLIPEDPKLKTWIPRIVTKVTFLTEPTGADVYLREYSDVNGAWKKAGITPIDSLKMPWFTLYQVKFVKAGYDTVLATTSTVTFEPHLNLTRKLHETGIIPPGMVYVDSYWDELKNIHEEGYGFFMDRYEVTNKKYKEFVDNGGYRRSDYWKYKFVKNGKSLSWDEAMAEFTDKTGRPGPSTWEAGDYPDGQDNYPVSGISWYEAAAYAEFAGKSLPTGDHWDSGVGTMWEPGNVSRITMFSNFKGKGIESVGKNIGLTSYGIYDMAGNVREWNQNETALGRLNLGGAYDDANYLFSSLRELPAFDRSSRNGFRCVKYIDRDKIPESAFRSVILGTEITDYNKVIPVAENIFEVYKNQFLYDSAALNSVIEERDEKPEDWIVEKATFNAAYGGERMIAYLFLPKNTPPPFQTLIFFPGSYQELNMPFATNNFTINWAFDYILKSGRAVIYPVYKGTFERNDNQYPEMMSHQYTERLTMMVKDFKRTIDYLETRKDIDNGKIGYYGHSWGGRMGAIIPAVEKRLSINILLTGGFSKGKKLTEADEVNYVSRIKIPTLMLNGRYDNFFPLETNAKPFFNLLGTPEKDKRMCVYETDHYVSRNDMIKEVLGWCDKYLGPVK